jgi:plastocyanin
MTQQAQVTRRRFLHIMGQVVVGCATLPLLQACSQYSREAVVINIVSHQPQAYFDPPALTIATGTQVVWHNTGLLVQTVTCDPQLVEDATVIHLPDNAEAWDSGDLFTGETYAHVFTMPGEYVYTSRYQREQPLIGLIRVTGTN